MSIYSLPKSAVFREDFTNQYTVMQNGGVVTGTGLANGRFLPATTGRINYNASSRYNAITVLALTNLTAFTGTYRTLIWCGTIGTGVRFQFGLRPSENKMFVSAGTIVTSTNDFTVGVKQSLAYVMDGTNISFYQNGSLLGTAARSFNTFEGLNIVLGNEPAGSQPFGLPIKTFQIFSTAFTPADALDWHKMATEAYI